MTQFTFKTQEQGNSDMKAYLLRNDFDINDWEMVLPINAEIFSVTTQDKVYEATAPVILPIPDINGEQIYMPGVMYIDDNGNEDSVPLVLINEVTMQ